MTEYVAFVADVELNLVWNYDGYRVEIVADKRRGLAHPAGEPFHIPAPVVARFLAVYGPRPNDASVSNRDGLISGLRRA